MLRRSGRGGKVVEFIAGVVLGAILGVVADRLWERIETKPRFKISASIKSDGYKSTSMRYLRLKIENVGRQEVPPFDLEFAHVDGSYHRFVTDLSVPLLPSQTLTYNVPRQLQMEVVEKFDYIFP